MNILVVLDNILVWIFNSNHIEFFDHFKNIYLNVLNYTNRINDI